MALTNNIHETNWFLRVWDISSDKKGYNLPEPSVKHSGEARRKELLSMKELDDPSFVSTLLQGEKK